MSKITKYCRFLVEFTGETVECCRHYVLLGRRDGGREGVTEGGREGASEHENKQNLISRVMIFPTMMYVRPAKSQISLLIRAD